MNARPVILIVDDEIINIEIMSCLLEPEYDICFAKSGSHALEIAGQIGPDLILLDIVMPGMDGYELCRRLKQDEALADVPVIFTTGLDGLDDEARGLSSGAIDYVTKPVQPEILRRRVANHLEMKRMRDQLADLAMTDALTGLGNRRRLEKLLRAELRRLARSGEWLSVIMLDIDFFKQFNDTYGHLEGDGCIRKVAAALCRSLHREGDFCARYGGEEFACILPETDFGGAMSVAEDMRRQVERLGLPNSGAGAASGVTVSLGVATGRCEAGLPAEIWLSNADRLLYQSKRAGRNRVTGQIIGPSPPDLAAMHAAAE
ncbi:diguanylate cyclase [Paracoccus lutimaris]|uniref:diguanylate cyclase n=1 Tax=Paracoccus lutimaris TaxID=1490030 RepID=A0A368YJ41_9RHOB|nr:diguanylate cyclase [Paracoccus lutimaris]RCW79629.1 response regulator receiver modulated diguanylate cyclase [Paracoccus lutimaris]